MHVGFVGSTKFVRDISYPGHWLASISLPEATDEDVETMIYRGTYHTW